MFALPGCTQPGKTLYDSSDDDGLDLVPTQNNGAEGADIGRNDWWILPANCADGD